MEKYISFKKLPVKIGLITLGTLSLNQCSPVKENKKPNLLFIMTDQQRFDALSIAGNKILKTPNLDQLAREGAYFARAYTPCAVCAPARSSILTGHTVENHGVLTNYLAYTENADGAMTMPTFDEIFQPAQSKTTLVIVSLFGMELVG